MTALEEAKEKLLPKLSAADRVELLNWLLAQSGETFPGIESTPGVCGGKPCIKGTRIPVWGLEEARRLGATEAGLLVNYPTLRAEDLANAWAYVATHREELDRQIQENAGD